MSSAVLEDRLINGPFFSGTGSDPPALRHYRSNGGNIVLRKNLAVITVAFLCSLMSGQVAPPRESGSEHVKHSRGQNYGQRYEAIKCAIVQVIRGEAPGPGVHYGTGFYVSPDGDIVTASHVLGDRIWTDKDGGITVDLPTPDVLTIVESSGEGFGVSKNAIVENRESWGWDLAIIKTNRKIPSSCWLAIGDDTKVRTGDSVITIGFPGLAFGSLSLYEGVVSATKMVNQLPVGRTQNTQKPVSASNTFIRVQLPISGGLSGAPVIDDENRAIAVVDAAGLWDDALDRLIVLVDTNQLGPPLLQPPFAQKDTLNMNWAVGELAKSFHQYSSPGYGDSVPLSYLKKKAETSSPPPVQPDH
jgi:hypothetical protein